MKIMFSLTAKKYTCQDLHEWLLQQSQAQLLWQQALLCRVYNAGDITSISYIHLYFKLKNKYIVHICKDFPYT